MTQQYRVLPPLSSSLSQPPGLALLRLPNQVLSLAHLLRARLKSGYKKAFQMLFSVTYFLSTAGHRTRPTPPSPQSPSLLPPNLRWQRLRPQALLNPILPQNTPVLVMSTPLVTTLSPSDALRSLSVLVLAARRKKPWPPTYFLTPPPRPLSRANMPVCSVTRSTDRFFLCADLDRPMSLIVSITPAFVTSCVPVPRASKHFRAGADHRDDSAGW